MDLEGGIADQGAAEVGAVCAGANHEFVSGDVCVGVIGAVLIK